MKAIIIFFLIISLGSIITGYLMDFENSEQLIGFGVIGLFFIDDKSGLPRIQTNKLYGGISYRKKVSMREFSARPK